MTQISFRLIFYLPVFLDLFRKFQHPRTSGFKEKDWIRTYFNHKRLKNTRRKKERKEKKKKNSYCYFIHYTKCANTILNHHYSILDSAFLHCINSEFD